MKEGSKMQGDVSDRKWQLAVPDLLLEELELRFVLLYVLRRKQSTRSFH